ncbi:putative membrane protein YczE [Pedobacter cryoconitis]|uniref:Putative membrane protein YczE n=1 Tax=Pedobacter cryoconitis TaxID=188932 RepID=A0A7W9DJC5_9SPHI|nr:putative membrane protein YczE [Pedobacter cryoconitis]
MQCLILAWMTIGQLLLFLILPGYLLYGIVKTVKNKNLTLLHKIVWISIIILLPIFGTSAYLRTTFTPKN